MLTARHIKAKVSITTEVTILRVKKITSKSNLNGDSAVIINQKHRTGKPREKKDLPWNN